MTEVGTTIAREEAKFIPATMKRVQHIEHAYECTVCKKIPLKSTNQAWESTANCHST
nr:IS66 family transposase zinc-finger binding domain-containing protein [Heyndrickxia vini]